MIFSFTDDFDIAMGRMSSKVVPEWDTDLNLRLQQLDSVLASASASSEGGGSSTIDETCLSTTTPNSFGQREHNNNNISNEGPEAVAEAQKPYACPSCDARFNSCGARNSHRRKVHERHHLCKDCDLAFGSAQKLERHLKTHTGVKEFRCETCGKEFMIERNLVSTENNMQYA